MKHNQAFIEFRSSLPKTANGLGVVWDIKSFATAVELLAPGFTVEAGQNWEGYRLPLWLVCPEHGRYQVRPNNFLSQLLNSGCPKCNAERDSARAGTIRKRRATETEKNEAKRLYAELGNYRKVGLRLGRSHSTIEHWCNNEYASKRKQRNAEWHVANREHKRETDRRYRTEFSHGKANCRASDARRRKRKRGEIEWMDEVAGLVTLLSPPTTGEDLTKEQAYYLEAERLTKETGIEHHVDHIWPLSKGGQHIFYNLQVITAEENLKKNARYGPEDQALYAIRVGMLFSNSI